MQTELESQLDAQASSLHQLTVSVTELNRRIARLSLILGLHLSNESDVVRVLQHDVRPKGIDPVADKRLSHQWIELRGLLVMRYHLEKSLVQDHGAAVTRRLLETAEHALHAAGFHDGDDGLDIERLFRGASHG